MPGGASLICKPLEGPMSDESNADRNLPGPGLLERLGLHRRELRAWAMYDWANSAMVTVVIATVFPMFFRRTVEVGEGISWAEAKTVASFRLAVASWIAITVAAVMAPVLGGVADYISGKKRLLGWFMGVGVAAVACMYFIQEGQWLLAAVLFIAANIAATGSFVFYDALLPHVAREEEMDRVSTAGFALGYVGGGFVLAGAFVLILSMKESFSFAARISFLVVAAWWVLFSIPLFLCVREPVRRMEPGELPGLNPFRAAFSRLSSTYRGLRQFRHAFTLLIAFLLYSDGINAIIRMAADYGQQLGISTAMIMGAILITQIIGIPFTFLFGMLAGRVGAKQCVYVGVGGYMLISVLAFFMSKASHFLALAILVGIVQGGTQALSRSLFASMIPSHRSGEFFGFFGVVDKFSGAIGIGLIAGFTRLTGQTRWGILAITLLFIAGAVLLRTVNVTEGQRIARQAASETGTSAASEIEVPQSKEV
jgi:MFS transporter, UMF1 family